MDRTSLNTSVANCNIKYNMAHIKYKMVHNSEDRQNALKASERNEGLEAGGLIGKTL